MILRFVMPEQEMLRLKKIEFPYEYRKGQKDMAACVYKAIDGGKRLFVQAPTGIGKTMAAVFPAVKAFSTGLVSKIFYLTAKTIASTMPDNAIEILRKQGMQFSSVILTAKEKNMSAGGNGVRRRRLPICKRSL